MEKSCHDSRRAPLSHRYYDDLLIRLLYTLGLRSGEALRLRIGDIDTVQATLFIRRSKFFKERIVPYGPRLAVHIQKYLELRKSFFVPVTGDAPLFFGRRGAVIPTAEIDKFLPYLLDEAGIETAPGKRRPRWHDLRHSFAVSRLLRWYEEGGDVQSKLTVLSTFMGHVEIYSTQIYLTITDNLLNEANKRFYTEFGQLY